MPTNASAGNNASDSAPSNTNMLTEFLNQNLNKLFRNWYFIECYPDCKIGNCPAYYIKTYPTEPEKRQNAIQHYTDILVSLFQKCSEPDYETVAMYIPASNKDTFSNCGKVVSTLAKTIPWMLDGTKSIIRTSSIAASHLNSEMKQDHTSQKNTLDITMDLSGRNVILFDDRCTSGNTAKQVTDLLYEHGAKQVWFIAFVLTDRQIFIEPGQNSPGAIYTGYFVMDCKYYTFDLWHRWAKTGRPYFHGPVRDTKCSDIRVYNDENSQYGYLTLNGVEWSVFLSVQEQDNTIRLVGKISDTPKEHEAEPDTPDEKIMAN